MPRLDVETLERVARETWRQIMECAAEVSVSA
jgi:hypothetical protein